jgi:hypothetical protein
VRTALAIRQPVGRAERVLHNHERVHHVVLFVFENVAVPDVLGALDAVAVLQRGAGRRASQHIEGRDDRCDLTGVRPERFLPPLLVGISLEVLRSGQSLGSEASS